MDLNEFLNTPTPVFHVFKKQCNTCQLQKEFEHFSQWTGAKGANRISSSCLECSEQIKRGRELKWHKENPDSVKKANAKWHQKNKEKRNEQGKAWKENNDSKYRKWMWVKQGIIFTDDEDFNYWYTRWSEATHCEVSGLPFDKTRNGLKCLDHNWTTGRPRGVIRSHINVAIGMIKDDHTILLQMEKYLNV